MAPAAGAGAEEDVLEVRCAGCGETLEVERGLTEFICPDCSTAQALPPELMPPPRRRRALPIPPARHPSAAPPARLPCGACGALLSVPPGLARCGCPVCGAELAVDAARLRQYLLSTAAAPLVPVSLPPVYQAREVHPAYPDSAFRVGHIREDLNNRPVHVERSQVRCQNTHALLEYPDPDMDRDHADTEILNETNVMQSHRGRTTVDARTSGAKRRQVEALNHVRNKEHAQQSNYTVHPECLDHTIHVGNAQHEYLNHYVEHIQLSKEKTIVRHSNQATGDPVGPKPLNVEKGQIQMLNQIAGQVQKPSSCNIICAEHATVPYPDQVIDLQEPQIHPVNHRVNAHVQLNNRISTRDGKQKTGHLVSCEAVGAKEIQDKVANKATKQASKQHYLDNMVPEEHAQTDHMDQMPMCHITYGGEGCLQKTNTSVVEHGKRQSGPLIGASNINAEERYVEPMEVMHEAEEHPSDISHTTQVHVEPPNDGGVSHGSKIATGAEPSPSCNRQERTMPSEQFISEEHEHSPVTDEIQTENIEAYTRNQVPGRTQKRKKGLIMASNNGQQLRRSKRLAPQSDAVVDTGCLQIEPSEQHSASPYQNLSHSPYMPELRSASLCVATSPASNPYLESHNDAIIGHDMHKTRSEAEPHVVYKGQGKTGPPKLLIPIEQELGHPGDNAQTELDEVEMTRETVRLADESAKRGFTSLSNEGFEHRCSKRLAKRSTPITYYESAESESEEHEAASPSQTLSDSPDIDQVSDDISSSSLRQHDLPERISNEADNLHVTTHPTSSIPDMSDPESFARYYSKIYPPDVRRAVERSPNLWLERLIHQNPTSDFHAGGKEKKRRGRGRSLCLKVWTMPEGVRVTVSLNDLGEPIGNEAVTFSGFLGTLIRDGTLAPLTYPTWRRFPEKNKDVMWRIVNLKFVIAPTGKAWAMKALGTKWKNWKSILKRDRYDSHETDMERLADRDPHVPEEQWKLLVAYWGTEEAKAASARSKASQAHQQPVRRHRSGTKSFARIREEERQKRPDKEEPSHTDMFILTHEPKDGKGKPIDKATADIFARLHEEAQKQRDGSANDSVDDVLAKVIGRRRGRKAKKVSLRQAMEDKRKAEEEAATLREKMLEMEENNRKLKEDLANANSPASSGVNRSM
ncbi:hypothetical protein ACP70R_048195 [Stipagrostis hirtigluma subsp. patula]